MRIIPTIVTENTDGLRQIFVRELKHLYWSEKQQLKLLEKAMRAASTRYLKAACKGHFSATFAQVTRLEKIFHVLNEKPMARFCGGSESLITEALQAIRITEKNSFFRDCCLIVIFKSIERYEIRCYNQLIALATALDNEELILILRETLTEEQEAEETFEMIMEDTLNDDRFKTDNPPYSSYSETVGLMTI